MKPSRLGLAVVVDVNTAIAVLDPLDEFHRAALLRCLEAESVAILNNTRSEALIHPNRAGKFAKAEVEVLRKSDVSGVGDRGARVINLVRGRA